MFRLGFGPSYHAWQENGGGTLNDSLRINEPRFCYKLTNVHPGESGIYQFDSKNVVVQQCMRFPNDLVDYLLLGSHESNKIIQMDPSFEVMLTQLHQMSREQVIVFAK